MTDKKTILIVEDEKDLVEWLTVFFNENGYNVISAYDGADGFAKAEQQKPDLITLDISMPGESGVKMYHKLIKSNATKKIPVVIITGAPGDLKNFITKVKTFPEPAGYFDKPVNRDALLDKVNNLIG
ncbi:MAG: response regulator transcription factor [candidate division Zixibacteria bacterium]|nr:response regulator transcription factor [candidate division Zixibacteria bacterium]